MPTFDETRTGYGNLWRRATVRPECHADAKAVAERALRDRARYQAIESKTGVPWFWIACIHDRESGGDFRGVLHNGEHIIGTGRKTSLVPAGRGPFATWEEAAIDALTFDKVAAIRDWSIERCLYQFEAYNGWGYTTRGVNSPYVWAGTSLQEPGKFTSDRHFDPSAMDTQLGCAAVLKLLAELDADVASRVSAPALAGVPSVGGEPPWMVKARGYIGFHETGTNRGIEEFIALAHTGSLGDPWCAIFANGMLEAVGVPGTRSAMARSFEHDDNFYHLDKAVVGCITTMWRGSPSSGSGHVGFFVKQDAQNVYLLDGNSSDEVGIHPHPIERVTGYWWPKSVPQTLPEPIPMTDPIQPQPQMPTVIPPDPMRGVFEQIMQQVRAKVLQDIQQHPEVIIQMLTGVLGGAQGQTAQPQPPPTGTTAPPASAPAAPPTIGSLLGPTLVKVLPMLGIHGGIAGLVGTFISIALGVAGSVPTSPTTGTTTSIFGGMLASGLLAKLFGKKT